jgi:Flp pilus assembly protein TadG
MGWTRGASTGSRGAAAVEFALVVPFLALLLFGIISYGMMLSFRQTVSQAAAEGARAAAVAPARPSTPEFGAVAKASAALASALGDGFACNGGALTKEGTPVGTCTVTTPSTCSATSCAYTVTVSYDYRHHPLIPRFPLVPMPGTLSYTASAQGNA